MVPITICHVSLAVSRVVGIGNDNTTTPTCIVGTVVQNNFIACLVTRYRPFRDNLRPLVKYGRLGAFDPKRVSKILACAKIECVIIRNLDEITAAVECQGFAEFTSLLPTGCGSRRDCHTRLGAVQCTSA